MVRCVALRVDFFAAPSSGRARTAVHFVVPLGLADALCTRSLQGVHRLHRVQANGGRWQIHAQPVASTAAKASSTAATTVTKATKPTFTNATIA